MSDEKLSPELITLLEREDGSARDAVVDAFVSLSANITPEHEEQLAALGVRIRTRAGDLVTCEMSLSAVRTVASLDFVTYVEGSRPLDYENRDTEG